uniref:Ubiquitin-like domain-containing protein n=1 Tax=Globodera rostochiensis TaxID=31243 RepID=A0A914GY78_GLORO
MTAKACSDESSSSDEDYYNDFSKYKAKAAMALRKLRKNERTTTEKSSLSSDVEDNTLHNFTSHVDHEICLIPTDTPVLTGVIDLTEVDSGDYASLPVKPPPPSSAIVCRINISSKGQKRVFFCDLAEPLVNVIEEFAERTNIDPKRDTPLALGLSDNCTAIELDAFEDLEQSEEDKGVKLKYQMKGRRPVTVCALPNATFALLKELFCTDHGLEPAKTRFILDSDLIGDNETPISLGLEDGDCIDVFHFD